MASLPPALKTVLTWPLLWEAALMGALGAFMFWVRMLPYNALVKNPDPGSGRPYFIGTDPFYHFRETLGIVRSFPRVPRWDPWTFYPNGTGTGQFGSIFDWLAALVVVVSQGKDASETYVGHVLGIFPAVLGSLMIIPFYFLARRLLGRPGAIIASITLALLPGEFLIRSVAGYSDHHVAEDFFSILAILGVVIAVERAHAARATLANLRRPGAYWKTLVFGVLGGAALAANFYAWPPAILFLGIMTIWLTLVILIENGSGRDGIGFAVGAITAFSVAGLLMVPTVETTNIGEYNTYGILQPILCFGAAIWLAAVHASSRAARKRGLSPWLVPGIVAAVVLVGFVGLQVLLADAYSSFRWGLSWITGIGAPRTTTTISEARPSAFFCDASSDRGSMTCLTDDFGYVPVIGVFLLIAVCGFAVWKRRRSDILLALWSLVIFNATRTQIRFSYYLAVNLALLLGWAAARVAEMTGLTRVETTPLTPEEAKKATRGRKTQKAAASKGVSRPIQLAAVAAVLLFVVPGNVIASQRSAPGWQQANINAPDGDLVLWFRGLDWMRENTPDAGVNLGLIAAKPADGQVFDYPATTYGVLSWWDYGHWIETTALRPPVANPFQQAAPFASAWFTERDPAIAETKLDDWVHGKGPIRYVWIDDEMATGKFGAITVWARNANTSRDQWPDGDFLAKHDYREDTTGTSRNLYTPGPEYTESMMGRLYDRDGDGLAHYRLVWEDPSYEIVGSFLDANGNIRNACFHEAVPSRNCPVGVDLATAAQYKPGTIQTFASDAKGYDLFVASRLKLFERVPGAHITGTAAPGAHVSASVNLNINNPGISRPFRHTQNSIAGQDGKFDIIFPYSTIGFVPPAQGGTNLLVKATSQVLVDNGSGSVFIDVPDGAVLHGDIVPVAIG